MGEQPVGVDNTTFQDDDHVLDCFPCSDFDTISPCQEKSYVTENNKSVSLSEQNVEKKPCYRLCLPEKLDLQRQRLGSSSSSSSESEITPSPFSQMQSSSDIDNKPITVNVSNLQTTGENCSGIHTAPIYNYQVVQHIKLPADQLSASEALKSLTSDAAKIRKKFCRQSLPANESASPKPALPENSGSTGGLKPQLQRRSCYLTSLVTVTCAILVVIAIVTLHFTASSHSHSEPTSFNPPPKVSSTQPAPTVHIYSSPGVLEGADVPGGPLMLDRGTWLAQPPTSTCVRHNLTLPVSKVVVCYTATDSCFTEPQCIHKIRGFQEYHIESKHWCDIAYNFLIGGDGGVYEGRGWSEVGSHTKGHNFGALGVAFIGTFIEKLPNDNQMKAFKGLLEVGVKLCKISADYSMYAQCQLRPTAAPGWALTMELHNNVNSWPHFNRSLAIQCTRPV